MCTIYELVTFQFEIILALYGKKSNSWNRNLPLHGWIAYTFLETQSSTFFYALYAVHVVSGKDAEHSRTKGIGADRVTGKCNISVNNSSYDYL